MIKSIGMVSLGCSKNQVDAERMLYKLSEAGYKLVQDAALAELVIVNTCGFINSAKEEAIETILEFVTLKKEGRIKKIIVSGCLSQRYKEETAELFPEVDAVLGIGVNDDIVNIVKRISDDEVLCEIGKNTDLSLTGKRIQTTLPFYSYLKIAEGCSNCCSYCAIPSIRGKFRSVPMEALLEEANTLAENGVVELNIIAQDSSRYGEDLYGKAMLPELLRELCKIENLKWIRVLYCYPERITDELLEVMASEEKIVKYLDIPIQHCNGEILKLMNRFGDEEFLLNLIDKIRTKIPEITLRTTLITGFPTETDKQFTALAKFVKTAKFDRLGCFAYSEEEGTKAALMEEQVPEEVRSHRAEIIAEQQQIIMCEKNEKLIGSELSVLVEGFDRYGDCYFGRSSFDAPEIDRKIFFVSPTKKLAIGSFTTVKITDILDYDLIGEIV